ncbi:MAG TPA: nuclear transport factor 2 family protein [Candidatus Limnocylindrales bacterium]
MSAEDDLIERWRGWQASIEARDVAAAGGFLADDYALELVQPERSVVPRAAWLALLPDYVVSGYAIEAQIVEVHGDIGLILHRARQEATVRGADRSDTFVLTDIWRRIDGTWRVWRRHSTPLAAGAMPPAR